MLAEQRTDIGMDDIKKDILYSMFNRGEYRLAFNPLIAFFAESYPQNIDIKTGFTGELTTIGDNIGRNGWMDASVAVQIAASKIPGTKFRNIKIINWWYKDEKGVHQRLRCVGVGDRQYRQGSTTMPLDWRFEDVAYSINDQGIQVETTKELSPEESKARFKALLSHI